MTDKEKAEMQAKVEAFIEQRNTLAETVDSRGLEIIAARDYITNELTKDHADYQTKMDALESLIKTQQTERAKIVEFDEFIENIQPVQILKAKDFTDLRSDLPAPDSPVTGSALAGLISNALQQPTVRNFYENIGEDIFNFIQKTGLTNLSAVKQASRSSERVELGTFNIAATFNAVVGRSPQERADAVKSLATEDGYGATILDTHKKQREAVKSMFTQMPDLAGGDGSQYDPTGVFEGNTGGLCEYDIDREIALLPYPMIKFMECIPVEQVPKIYRLFVRQTLRVNNADSVNETIYTPPVDFIVTKPESAFGFTQDRAFTVVFADTLPVSEEFLEECEPIADAVRNQLLTNVWQAFVNQVLNGDGSTGTNPQLLGFMNTVGVSTRIHQGAATYNGVAQGAGAGTDEGRDTLERMIFDSEAFGYIPDCVLISHNDYVDMSLQKDADGKKLYSEAELNNIRGARLIYETRMTDGFALAAPFRQVTKVLIRRGLQFDIGWVSSQYVEDAVTFRVRMRGGNMVRQPFALIRGSALTFA